MDTLYFLHFMKWAGAPASLGGGGGRNRYAKHIKVVINIGGPLLGLPKIVAGLFSAEAEDIVVARTVAPGVLDKDIFGFQTLQHAMRMTRTWDSTMSLIPKGGDTIWGTLDWVPEHGHDCSTMKVKPNDTQPTSQNEKGKFPSSKVNYGRIISFGKDFAALHSSKIDRIDFKITECTCDGDFFDVRSWISNRKSVHKFNAAADQCYIPFQIDTSANGGIEESCLRSGVFSVDDDETIPTLSVGFMCAKGWRGQTIFNPSGIKTYVREYDHAPPATLLEGTGTQSGAHVDIMGNFALIEDVIRVAAGACGKDFGGDQVYSNISGGLKGLSYGYR